MVWITSRMRRDVRMHGRSHEQLNRSMESFNKGTTATCDTTVKTGKYFIPNTGIY